MQNSAAGQKEGGGASSFRSLERSISLAPYPFPSKTDNNSMAQGVAAAQAGVSVVQPNVGRTRDWYAKHPGVIRDPHVSFSLCFGLFGLFECLLGGEGGCNCLCLQPSCFSLGVVGACRCVFLLALKARGPSNANNTPSLTNAYTRISGPARGQRLCVARRPGRSAGVVLVLIHQGLPPQDGRHGVGAAQQGR